jgi:hypothetical protein
LQVELDKISVKPAYDQATIQMKSRYVTHPDFCIKFLRAELWDPHKAARRLIKHLELLLRYFGPFALTRPLAITDLSSDAYQLLRTGNYQILPSRDRAGRLILSCQGWMSLPTPKLRVRQMIVTLRFFVFLWCLWFILIFTYMCVLYCIVLYCI